MMDLHMHSRYSEDGEFTPMRLVELCYEKGVTVLSVTDHNCAKADREAALAARQLGIAYVPGIEIDCTFSNVGFHVLGYGIDAESRDFAAIEENVRRQSRAASLERLELIRRLGFRVEERELEEANRESTWPESWTGELFAQVLLQKPEDQDHPLLAPYRTGGARSDNPYVNFYWDFCSQGKPCYAEVRYPEMADVIAVIHRNGGTAVLAHPGVNLKGHDHLLDAILGLGMDGIEAFSSYHSPAQREYFLAATEERKLLVTCGSDFHGKTKPSVAIGGHGCDWSDEELGERLGALLSTSGQKEGQA